MTCTFSAEQITALSAPLDRAKVRQREQGRSQVSYLEGWQVIAEANRIFGFDGWQRETVALRCVNQSERTIGARGTSRDQRPGWGVTYTARVRITVGEGTGAQLIREGCGAGHGIDTDLGQAHESALKEAETDAMKRALMTFGNAFGLALYDKQQREVTGGAPGGGDRSSSGQASRPRSTPLRVVPTTSAPALHRAPSTHVRRHRKLSQRRHETCATWQPSDRANQRRWQALTTARTAIRRGHRPLVSALAWPRPVRPVHHGI